MGAIISINFMLVVLAFIVASVILSNVVAFLLNMTLVVWQKIRKHRDA